MVTGGDDLQSMYTSRSHSSTRERGVRCTHTELDELYLMYKSVRSAERGWKETIRILSTDAGADFMRGNFRAYTLMLYTQTCQASQQITSFILCHQIFTSSYSYM